jgi:hypothetical protein
MPLVDVGDTIEEISRILKTHPKYVLQAITRIYGDKTPVTLKYEEQYDNYKLKRNKTRSAASRTAANLKKEKKLIHIITQHPNCTATKSAQALGYQNVGSFINYFKKVKDKHPTNELINTTLSKYEKEYERLKKIKSKQYKNKKAKSKETEFLDSLPDKLNGLRLEQVLEKTGYKDKDVCKSFLLKTRDNNKDHTNLNVLEEIITKLF